MQRPECKYTVGNVDVKYRSQLRSIHLALLLRYKCVRKYGYRRVLEPLLRDLRILESQSIDITVDGESFHMKGSVVTLSGDNLSMHAIGGFNPSFSSGRICRHCLTCYSQKRDVESEEHCTRDAQISCPINFIGQPTKASVWCI